MIRSQVSRRQRQGVTMDEAPARRLQYLQHLLNIIDDYMHVTASSPLLKTNTLRLDRNQRRDRTRLYQHHSRPEFLRRRMSRQPAS